MAYNSIEGIADAAANAVLGGSGAGTAQQRLGPLLNLSPFGAATQAAGPLLASNSQNTWIGGNGILAHNSPSQFAASSSSTQPPQPPSEDRGQQPRRTSSLWSVPPEKTLKCGHPQSDDLNTWTHDQLKAECTARKLQMPTRSTASARRDKIAEHEAVKAAGAAAVQSVSAPGATALPYQRGPHDIPRLINTIVLDDGVVHELTRTGQQLNYRELGVDRTSREDRMWAAVTAA
eukprot:GHVU01081660.1.p1 GENE.GHVU01081660.1~~GHVU01081660.1.p1  ORF type:complete len:233 (+),score=28.67 GHVU01081660.1:226-924(+)